MELAARAPTVADRLQATLLKLPQMTRPVQFAACPLVPATPAGGSQVLTVGSLAEGVPPVLPIAWGLTGRSTPTRTGLPAGRGIRIRAIADDVAIVTCQRRLICVGAAQLWPAAQNAVTRVPKPLGPVLKTNPSRLPVKLLDASNTVAANAQHGGTGSEGRLCISITSGVTLFHFALLQCLVRRPLEARLKTPIPDRHLPPSAITVGHRRRPLPARA